MKQRVIKKILKEQFEDFINSIEDENVKEIVKKNSFITGGAVVSLLLNEKIHDLDIYFKDIDSAIVVAKYYVNVFNKTHNVDKGVFKEIRPREDSAGIIINIDYNYGIVTEKMFSFNTVQNKYRPVAFSQNAITIKKTSTKIDMASKTVQLILRFVGNSEEIHSNFDFIHCTNVYIPYTNTLILNEAALKSIITKELCYMGSKYPIASIIRTRKYINRGWAINAGQYLKMAFQINDLNLRDINVLRDQLIGVDATYFLIFIEYLENKNIKEMDTSEICRMIDNIFDNLENTHDIDDEAE